MQLINNVSINETIQTLKIKNILLGIFLAIVIYFLSSFLTSFIFGIAISLYLFRSGYFTDEMIAELTGPAAAETVEALIQSDTAMLLMLFLTLVPTLALYLFSKYAHGRNGLSLGLVSKTKGKDYLIGLGIGFGSFAFAVLIAVVTGSMRLAPQTGAFSFGFFILFFIGFMFQGFSEEFLTRSILMNLIAARSTVIKAVVINSLLFALLHFFNNSFSLLPAVNLFLAGLLFSLLFYLTDNIFVPAACHTMWNFVQGHVFGISVSGMPVSQTSLLHANMTGSTLINGGSFGLEGGIATTLSLILINTAVAVLIHKNLKTQVDKAAVRKF